MLEPIRCHAICNGLFFPEKKIRLPPNARKTLFQKQNPKALLLARYPEGKTLVPSQPA
jgi:hypothetical protein